MNNAMAQNILFTEHILWLKNLDQVQYQLKELQKRLEKSTPSFHDNIIMPRMEQFQKRLIRQREVMDLLRHEIEQHENKLESKESLAHILLQEHIALREQFNRFYELFIEFEHDFDKLLR